MTSRPREIEQWSNLHLVHPVSARAADFFVSARFSANAVSVLGLVVLVVAAWLFTKGQPYGWGGAALLYLSHVLDGADGQVARRTGQASRFGEIVDGVCDYLGYAFLYAGIAIALSHGLGWPMALPVIATTMASHIVQANLYETRRRQYCHRVHGVAWIGTEPPQPGSLPVLLRAPAALFLAISQRVSGENPQLVRRLSDASFKARFATLKRRHVKRYAILGQNVKSFALGLAAVFSCFTCYAAFVVIVLNLALLALWMAERRDEDELATS